MATFTQGFTITTSSDGTNLLITDTSIYGGLLPKSVFTSRSVTITKTNGDVYTINFPYTGSADNVQDVLTITNYLDKDYYLTVKVDWAFNNEGTPDTDDYTLDYLSNYNALVCFVNTADATDFDCDSCDCSDSEVLNKLSNYIDNAILWAKFGNGVKSQKYLDASKDICDSLEDCNCNN